jgi:hypothetical protein
VLRGERSGLIGAFGELFIFSFKEIFPQKMPLEILKAMALNQAVSRSFVTPSSFPEEFSDGFLFAVASNFVINASTEEDI